MINFIKNDKYISFINIVIVFTFLFTKINLIWFLVIELLIIMLYLIFMLYRFYLRSKVEANELVVLKKLYKRRFKYENYSDIYEDEDSFDLEIGEYKKLLCEIIDNFMRMDKKLVIKDYEYINLGLKYLKDSVNNNDKRKKDYELISKSVSIIKKYYDKDCIRKDGIKNYKKLLLILIILTVISFIILISCIIMNNSSVYSIISSVYIVILFIVDLIIYNKNKEVLIDIDSKDKKILEDFQNKKYKLKKELNDYFKFLQFDCEDLLNNNNIRSYEEIKKEYEKNKDNEDVKKTKKIIDILFKYRNKNGKKGE